VSHGQGRVAVVAPSRVVVVASRRGGVVAAVVSCLP
jgi:hypothetical protein